MSCDCLHSPDLALDSLANTTLLKFERIGIALSQSHGVTFHITLSTKDIPLCQIVSTTTLMWLLLASGMLINTKITTRKFTPRCIFSNTSFLWHSSCAPVYTWKNLPIAQNSPNSPKNLPNFQSRRQSPISTVECCTYEEEWGVDIQHSMESGPWPQASHTTPSPVFSMFRCFRTVCNATLSSLWVDMVRILFCRF
jgi:hypothetical protein